jgi:chromosome segregation ATPase
MIEWIVRSKDNKRKALVESVASVSGKKSRICSAVESLEAVARRL